MAEIKNIDLSRLLQDEDFGFHDVALAEFQKCNDTKFTEVLNDYKTKYETFDAAMKKSGGENVLTSEVTRLDQQRDENYRALKRQNNVVMKDFDETIAEIGRQVDIILRRNGDPCSLPYLAQNSAIINLIQDLEEFDNAKEEDANIPEELSDDSEDTEGILLDGVYNRLNMAGLDRWLARLKESNEKFITVFTERNSQQATIVNGATRAARKEIDLVYKAVVKRLNALAEVNGDTDYAEIINNMNNLIDRQKAILAARKTNNAKKKEDTDKPTEL